MDNMSQEQILMMLATFLVSAAIMVPIGYFLRKKIAESKIQSAENEAKRLLENAGIEAENKKKEEIFKAKEEILQARHELDKEIKERRGEVALQEKRMIQKEESLEKRNESFERREKELERKHQDEHGDRDMRDVPRGEAASLPHGADGPRRDGYGGRTQGSQRVNQPYFRRQRIQALQGPQETRRDTRPHR